LTDETKKRRPPVVLTDEQVHEVRALSAVLNTQQIADYLGVSHVTFKAIRDRDERISFAYKNGKAKAIASIGTNLISTAKKGNVTAMIFYLKTQAGWKETQVVEVEAVKSFNDMYEDEIEDDTDDFDDMYQDD